MKSKVSTIIKLLGLKHQIFWCMSYESQKSYAGLFVWKKESHWVIDISYFIKKKKKILALVQKRNNEYQLTIIIIGAHDYYFVFIG